MVSIVVNIGILLGFKYFNFFIDSANQLFALLPFDISLSTLNIIVPIGISFYTFQTLGYTIDVYRKKVDASHSFLQFAAYVSFFPQLVAGPIERAGRLLPQFSSDRKVDYDLFVRGVSIAAIGFFKKVVIADNIAAISDPLFANIATISGIEIAAAAILFSFQIYYDFSGYSDIAIGVAAMIGFKLTKNFDRPYFSKNPSEFWNRWHISLSSWFQDYLYMPIAIHSMRKGMGFFYRYQAHFYTMLLVGLWHGAHFRFIIFGLFWAIALIAYNEFKKSFDKIPIFFSVLITYSLACFGWFLFRIQNSREILYFFENIGMQIQLLEMSQPLMALFLVIMAMMIYEVKEAFFKDLFQKIPWPNEARLVWVLILIFVSNYWGADNQVQFIYFQF